MSAVWFYTHTPNHTPKWLSAAAAYITRWPTSLIALHSLLQKNLILHSDLVHSSNSSKHTVHCKHLFLNLQYPTPKYYFHLH
jgi:hypothetical protein